MNVDAFLFSAFFLFLLERLEAKLARQKARMESLKEQQLKEAAATDDNEDEENIRAQQVKNVILQTNMDNILITLKI